jgi:hypothetical protein
MRSHTKLHLLSSHWREKFLRVEQVKGEPSDISPMTVYAWFEWVKFCDTSVNFPDSKIQLERDTGAVIDIGPAMARKVLNTNG